MSFGFRLIRRTFQILLALWLFFAMALGFGNSWLEHHPDSGLAAVGGFASVDPNANIFTQAGQFANGMTKTRDEIEFERHQKQDAEADRIVRQQAEETRKFNSGGDRYSDDY